VFEAIGVVLGHFCKHQLVLCLAIGRRQHEQEDAEIFLHIGGRKAAGLVEHERAAGGDDNEMLAIRVRAVLQRPPRLIENLTSWQSA